MILTDATSIEVEAFGELTACSRPGGQGRVYRPARWPHELDEEPPVVKLYRRPVAATAAEVLSEMVRWERSLEPALRTRLLAVSAWPVALVTSRGTTVGIAMRDLTPRFATQFVVPSGRSAQVLLSLEHLLGPDWFLRNRGLDVWLDTRLRALVAERVSDALAFLHRHGVAAGDIAPSNLLAALAPPRVDVCLIDCDSMVFRGRQALPPVETGDWNLPSEFGEASGTRAADAYKLGLVVLRLFARSHDARSVAPHLRYVPVQVRDLLHRALSADAANRPPAGEWQRALAGLLAAGTLDALAPRDRLSAPASAEPVAPPAHVAPAPTAPPARVAPVPATWRARPVVLRRVVVVLWLVALVLGLGALLVRIERRPAPARVPTIIYVPGPAGRVVPSVERLQGAVPAGQP